MQVVNVHRRILDAPHAPMGSLLDALGSDRDRLWPGHARPHRRLALARSAA